MATSAIEWTDATWNPIAGCSMISPGCTNCYAMRMAARLEAMGMEKYRGTTRPSGGRRVWSGRINLDEDALDTPLRWRRPRRIFVNSMSDLFHEDVPASFIRRVWSVMERAGRHEFQLLTKRPERMLEVVVEEGLPLLPNAWLGTSVESADHVRRIDVLRRVPARVRFVSFEPLLGPIGAVDLDGIDWAIVGGESGPGARPIDPQWVEEVLDSCREQKVAFFFKQWGGTRKKRAGRLLHGRIWDEYPAVAAPAVA